MKTLRLLSSGRVWLFGLLVVALSGACSNSSSNGKDAGAADMAARADGPVDKVDAPTESRPDVPTASDARDDGGDAAMCTSNKDGGRGGKTLGEACGCAADCASGFCADGVCCNSTCGDKCKTCNLASSLGTCTFVPAGVADKEAFCTKEPMASCGNDGTCDGKGDCRKYEAGSECLPGKCDSDSLAGGYVCDGKSNCVLGPVMSCSPFTCNPAANQCLTTCTSNNDCGSGHQCMNGSCGKLPLGAVCSKSDACASNFCVDGVCCNAACNTPCLSCNQTGYGGHCRLLEAGVPDSDCKALAAATCGTTGLCDAFGACAKYPQGTVCVSATCAGLIRNTPAVCDGNGTCGGQGVADCTPFLCTGGACTTLCNNDNGCAPGHACNLTTTGTMTVGVCAGKKKPGATCTQATECESNFCVDGVCCTSTCAGGCRTCNSQGSAGTCTNTAAGSADPRGTCNDNGKKACDLNGVCDGNGSCAKYAADTQCGPESCNGGVDTALAMCNGAHQCVPGTSRSCAPFACNGTSTCFDRCTNDNQCTKPNTCMKGSCGLKDPPAPCTDSSECKGGHCAQGVCCNSDCTGACTSCSLPGTEGTCSQVNNGADPHGLCAVTVGMTCGTTGLCKAGACAKWDTTTKCKDASCPTAPPSLAIAASFCDGAGVCKTPSATMCGAFVCSGGSCNNTCTGNAQCIAPNICINNSCGLKAPGQACGAATECSSGFCTEGVCCDKACSDAAGSAGVCQSCKVTGKVGTCSPVTAGGSDPKNRCVATDPLSGDCSNNGTCNGGGACGRYSTSTSCSKQSCTAGMQHNQGTCSASGTCTTPTPTTCAPFVCDSAKTSCLTTCTSDADCTGTTCIKTNNRCGDKLGAGATCVASTDCLSNVCSEEKVCCDAACTAASSPCKSCISGTARGICSAITGMPRNTTSCAKGSNVCGNTGLCDGAGACDLAAPGTACLPGASCPAGSATQTAASTCNGTGTCVTPAATTCGGGFLCDASTMSCKGTCTTATAATDCAANYYCSGTACQAKKTQGATCTMGLECGTGNCVEGVCCDTACSDATSGNMGLCRSCKVTNKVGVCSPVAMGGADPKNRCAATDPLTSCANNGTCDGAGACDNWSTSTQCRTPSCSDATHTQITAANCPASGSCPPMTSSSCMAGYLCAGTACATTCTSDTQCDVAGGYSCDTTNHCTIPVSGTGGAPGTGGSGSGGSGTGGDSMGGAGGA